MERAVDWLRKKGVAAANSKSGRTAAQGLVATAVDDAGDRAVLVEVCYSCRGYPCDPCAALSYIGARMNKVRERRHSPILSPDQLGDGLRRAQ